MDHLQPGNCLRIAGRSCLNVQQCFGVFALPGGGQVRKKNEGHGHVGSKRHLEKKGHFDEGWDVLKTMFY